MQGRHDAPGGGNIPGYSVQGLLGAGPSGEVWLATEDSTRQQVAIKRLQLDPVDGSDALHRLVATLDALAHPHLLRIRSITGGDRQPSLVTDFAESGSLGQLLRSRRHLAPGEVVTVLGPVAEALAAVHGRGLVHGAVTPENIVFTQDGRPLLSDTAINQLTAGDGRFGGTHGFTDPNTGSPTAAGDVFGLAAVGWAALTGTAPSTAGRPALLSLIPGVPPGLAHAIEAGLQDDPQLRPAADRLADMVYAATSPAPVRFPVGLVQQAASGAAVASAATAVTGADRRPDQPADETRVPGHARRDRQPGEDNAGARRPSPLLLFGLAGGGALVVVAAVVLGLWAFGRHDRPVPPVSRPPVTTPAPGSLSTPMPSAAATGLPSQPAQPAGEWTAIVRGLVGLRAQAFERADPAIVDMVFIGGSPAADTDSTLVTALRERGQHAEHYRLRVASASVASRSASQVRLHAVTQQQAYTVVSSDGARVRTHANPPLEADIVLRKAADGYWRIYNW